uniref:NAD(P)-binding protein n=1 Tax=Caenorhabditis tropicalis TaxID=1561998 RepID=A0A1I7UAV9_9PELO
MRSPKSVVVTGSNRGLGFGLIQQFLKDPNVEIVIATSRDIEKATALKSISDPRLHILQLSLGCDESINSFAQKVSEIVGDTGLTLLINNAAVMLPYVTKQEPDRKIVNDLFESNTIGPMILTQKLIPLIIKSSKSEEGSTLSVSRGAIINIASEFLGSISENTSGSGEYKAMAYRMTKCAVNQFTKTLSIDLREDYVLSAGICPGKVQTDMSKGKGEFTIEEASAQLIETFKKLDERHNGGYFRKDLSVIPY